MKELIQAAKKVYGVDPMKLTRERNHVWARRAIYAQLRSYNMFTLEYMGNIFGQDHTTVMNAHLQHDNLMKFDKEYQAHFNAFKNEDMPIFNNSALEKNLTLIKNLDDEKQQIVYDFLLNIVA